MGFSTAIIFMGGTSAIGTVCNNTITILNCLLSWFFYLYARFQKKLCSPLFPGSPGRTSWGEALGSPLTINAINVSWGDFGGDFSCMKVTWKFGGAYQPDEGAGHLLPQKWSRHESYRIFYPSLTIPKMAPTGEQQQDRLYLIICKLKLTRGGRAYQVIQIGIKSKLILHEFNIL